MADQMTRLKHVRAKMLVKHPFFATLMMSMPMVITTDIPTAATDMKSLYINPQFLESIDDDVLMFVIAHEIMHTALEHGMRLMGRVHLRWNVACIADESLVLLATGEEVPASEVRVGDYLWSPKGPSQVLEVLDRGVKEVVQLTHSGGECLVTADHRFLTDGGFSDAYAQGAGLRQDIYAVSGSARLRARELQDYVDPRHDCRDESRISQRGGAAGAAGPDRRSLHDEAAERRSNRSSVGDRVSVPSRDHRRRGNDHGTGAREVLTPERGDQQHIVPAAGLDDGARIHAHYVAEHEPTLVLEDFLEWVRSGPVIGSCASVSSDQGASRRSALGVHLDTSSSVERRAADGSYARDCVDFSLVERADVDVRRTGETRHVLDFVTEHHVYSVGGLICHNCDYAINLILDESKFKVWDQALLDKKYADMSADQIYNQLTKEEDQQKKSGGKGEPQKGQPQPGGAGGQQQPGQPDDQQGQQSPGTGEVGNEHHSPMLGDLKQPEEAGDPVAEDKLRKEIQQRVAQAASIARMTGNLPGSIERFVKQVLEPKVPWYDVLRHLMTELDACDEDWMHRNRRFSGIYLPSDHSEARMGIAVGIGDTSGSIGNDELCNYGGEFVGICEQTKPEEIRMVWADTKVAGEQVFEPGDDVKLEPKGGGGTDMRVPLKHVEQFEPKIVVLFTDGHTPWPKEEPPYPLIVCCTTGANVPIGEVIRI